MDQLESHIARRFTPTMKVYLLTYACVLQSNSKTAIYIYIYIHNWIAGGEYKLVTAFAWVK